MSLQKDQYIKQKYNQAVKQLEIKTKSPELKIEDEVTRTTTIRDPVFKRMETDIMYRKVRQSMLVEQSEESLVKRRES